MDRILTVEEENLKNLRSFIMTLASYYTIGLYLIFAAVDYIFYPQYFFEFFIVRVAVVLNMFLVNRLLTLNPNGNFRFVQWVSTLAFFGCSSSIHYMIFRINEPLSAYWAGLAIVAAGLSIGFTFSWRFYLGNMALIFFPLFGFSLHSYIRDHNISYFLSPIFLGSISLVCITGRWFYTKLSESEYLTRKQLAEEVESRNKIIEEQTKESVRLNALSKQFSPQIVQSIKSRQISLGSKVHRSEICAIFVDIKDSTIKFSTLDRDDLQKIIAMYMEDVMSVFLKYDITIDKFLGDGVMGFTNDPVEQHDYLERAILAANEVKTKISLKQELYMRYWGSEFQVRLGLSSGYASVGFYGSDLHVKSYTAIGRVINLASRVNGAAPANEIAITSEIISKIKERNEKFLRDYKVGELEYQTLKGFEHERLKLFTIDKFETKSIIDDENCPNGHGGLVVHQLENGIYAMKCRYCDYVLQDSSSSGNSGSKAA